MKIFHVLAAAVCLCLLSACGGTVRDLDTDSSVASDQPFWSGERIPVLIHRVENRTGEKKYDDLSHYVHIKAAQLLADTGRYDVVSDELLEQQSIFMDAVVAEPQAVAAIEIGRVVGIQRGEQSR